MQAVEMLSSYISRGVYTVSGPFHPFGGAVDVIVVEQQDGSFKSSPWYVRFGKFQGVLKTREKVVKIFVNGEEAKFHMYLDHKGEAYFLKESESDEGEYFLSPPTSGDETDGDMTNARFKKSQSCDFESKQSKSVSQFEIKNKAIMARKNSRRSRFFGLVFGRNSVKEDINHGNMPRLNSLERAEIAADLLETRWSTNLTTNARRIKSFPKNHFEGDHSKHVPVDSRQIVENGKDPVSLDENNENRLGNVSANMEHIEGKSSDAASSLATHKEVIEMYRSDTGEILDRHGVFVDISDAKPHEFDTALGDSVFNKPIAEMSSPAFAIVSNETEDILDDMGRDLVGANSVDSGKGKEVSSYFFYETYESSSVRYAVSDDEILQSQNKYRDENMHDKHNGETVIETAQLFSEVNSEAVNELITHHDKSTETKLGCSEHLQGECSTYPEHDCHVKDACKLNTVSPCIFGTEDTGSGTLSFSEDTIGVTTVDMLKIDHFNQNKKDATQALNFDNQLQLHGRNTSINLDVMGYLDTHQLSSSTGVEPCCIHVDSNHARDQIQVGNVTEEVIVDKLILPSETTISESTAGHLSSTEKPNNNYSLPKNIEQDEFLFGEDGQGDNELFLQNITAKVDQPGESLMFDPEEGDAEEHEINDPNDEPSKSFPRASTCQSSPIDIPANKASLDSTNRLIQSLPNIRSHIHDLESSDVFHQLSHSLHSSSTKVQSYQHKEEFTSCSAITVDQVALSESSIANVGKDTERVGSNSDLKVELSLCKHLLFQGMGAEAAARAFDSERVDREKFAALGSSVIKNKQLIVRIHDRYFPYDAAAPFLLGMISFGDGLTNLEGMISVDRVEKCGNEDSSKAIVPSGGTWKLWPFSFKKSQTITEEHLRKNVTKQKDAEVTLEDGTFSDVSSMPRRRSIKKRVQSITPSSEQLASLDLKEGRNLVTFSFETAMLGRQQVDARIYLWKWNTRIVVSDVDGTITKSDVLGQVMPLVGKDWSQTGVTHLFSSIKDNGYQFIFLSARAISQAHLTRQFLFNLKQDGKALPDGPVVISPDGLFPSLYREVIRRAPHEFKISCLEDIRALFPQECNPFYAGFGNRHTDEISYLKVGIPKGKIFTINPKGEVAVNRRVDTKSYTSLHALVNGMFPATQTVEQEDFNSWNYWRLPLPDIEDS